MPEPGADLPEPSLLPPSQWPHEPPPSPPAAVEIAAPAPPGTLPAPPPLAAGPAPQWAPDMPHEWRSPPEPTERPDPPGEALLGACIAYAAGVALVAAPFLGWIRAAGEQVSGWDATPDARFVLAFGIASLVVATAVVGGVITAVVRWTLFGLAVVATAIGVSDIVDAGKVSADVIGKASAGVGPWLTVAAGLVLALSVLLVRPAEESAPAASSHASGEPRSI